MKFNPVATEADFTQRRFPDALQYDREQKFAHQHDAFAPDIQAEIDKLLWCDLLILQFPLWWFSVPAIMKGWIDRVFVNGVVDGTGRRLFLMTPIHHHFEKLGWPEPRVIVRFWIVSVMLALIALASLKLR